MADKELMVFPFTVPIDAGGNMRDLAQGVYARSLARTLAERLSVTGELKATAATLTSDGPLEGAVRDDDPEEHGWVVASQPWTLEEACEVTLPEGTQYLLHGTAELTDRVRLRLLVVDQPGRAMPLDHVVLRPRAELFAALEEAAQSVARAVGVPLPEVRYPTDDVEAFLCYLRGRDMSAAHEAGVHVADPARSFEPYLDALRRDPTFEEAQEKMLGLALDFALGGQGPSQAAKEACEQLLSMNADAYKATAALAEMDLHEGRPGEAAERLRTVLAKKPDWWPVYERLGTALVRLGKHADAIPRLETALLHAPDDADALDSLGMALYATGRYDEAVQRWRAAVSGGRDTAHLHEHLAKALGRMGRSAEAREHRSRARKLSGGGFFGWLQDVLHSITGDKPGG